MPIGKKKILDWRNETYLSILTEAPCKVSNDGLLENLPCKIVQHDYDNFNCKASERERENIYNW
jgi:hypothetical protein